MSISIKTSDGFDRALNMARQALYRFAALSLANPRTGSWSALSELQHGHLLRDAAELIRETPGAVIAELAPGERAINGLDPQYVLRLLPKSPQALNDEYEAAFGLLVTNACPPCETEYIDSRFDFQRSNALADVSGFYRAFGLATSEDHPERPDHIVLELEFMAFLLGKERQAERTPGPLREERMGVCAAALRRFLREHLAWWVPAFCHLLAKEGSGRFYEEVAEFLASFLPAERALLGVPPARRPSAPTPLERPEECEGCLQSAGI